MKTLMSEEWFVHSGLYPKKEELIGVLEDIDRHTVIRPYEPEFLEILFLVRRDEKNLTFFPLRPTDMGWDFSGIEYQLKGTPLVTLSVQSLLDAGLTQDDLIAVENEGWLLEYDPDKLDEDDDRASILIPSSRFESTFFKRLRLNKIPGGHRNMWRFGFVATLMNEAADAGITADDFRMIYRVGDDPEIGRCFAMASHDFVMNESDAECFQNVWDELSKNHQLALRWYGGMQRSFSIAIELNDLDVYVPDGIVKPGVRLAFSDICDGKYELAPCLFYKDTVLSVGGISALSRHGHSSRFDSRKLVESFEKKGVKALEKALGQLSKAKEVYTEDPFGAAMHLMETSGLKDVLGTFRFNKEMSECGLTWQRAEREPLLFVYNNIFELLEYNWTSESSPYLLQNICKEASGLFSDENVGEFYPPPGKITKRHAYDSTQLSKCGLFHCYLRRKRRLVWSVLLSVSKKYGFVREYINI